MSEKLSVGLNYVLKCFYLYLLYFAWANQRHRQCCIRRLRGGARYTMIVLAFLTQENKAGKMQSTINQLKHGKGRAVRAIMVLGVVSIDHTPRTIIARTALPSVL